MYGTKAKGVRYLEMAEGYVTRMALDKDDQVIGYEFVSLGKMTDFIKKGDDPEDSIRQRLWVHTADSTKQLSTSTPASSNKEERDIMALI